MNGCVRHVIDVEAAGLPLVVFEIAGRRYGVPLSTVVRVLPMVLVSPLPGPPAIMLGVINLRGQVLPVVDVGARLGDPRHDCGLAAHLLVVRTTARTLVLPVDAVSGVEIVRPEAVTAADVVVPGCPGLVAGIAAVSNGLLFIYDLEALLSKDEEQELARALGEPAW